MPPCERGQVLHQRNLGTGCVQFLLDLRDVLFGAPGALRKLHAVACLHRLPALFFDFRLECCRGIPCRPPVRRTHQQHDQHSRSANQHPGPHARMPEGIQKVVAVHFEHHECSRSWISNCIVRCDPSARCA